jgi:hypothetical protein
MIRGDRVVSCLSENLFRAVFQLVQGTLVYNVYFCRQLYTKMLGIIGASDAFV